MVPAAGCYTYLTPRHAGVRDRPGAQPAPSAWARHMKILQRSASLNPFFFLG